MSIDSSRQPDTLQPVPPTTGPARRTRSTLVKASGVVALMVFAFWVGMMPHLNFRYPLHVDEWFALGYAQSTLESGSLQYSSPYYYGEHVSFHAEMGFHLILGFLQATTGLPWMGLYNLAPGVLLVLLTFMVYALGRRRGFGWAAALFVPLIPTSIRTLGPAFWVPMSTALLSIPAALLLLQNLASVAIGRCLWLLLLLVGGTILIHPTTEGALTGLAAFYLAALLLEFLARRQYRRALGFLAATALPLLVPLAILVIWIPSRGLASLRQAVSIDPSSVPAMGFNTGFFQAFGEIAVVLFVIGVFLFSWERRYGLWSYALPAFAALLLFFLTFLYPRFRVGPDDLYERGWTYAALLMAVLAGYGVAAGFRFIRRWSRTPPGLAPGRWAARRQVVLYGIGMIVVLAAILNGLTGRDRQMYANYYHMMDDRIAADFAWMGEHTVPGRKVVVMEPSLGWAYPPLAGPGNVVVGAMSAPYSSGWTEKVRAMLTTGEVDTAWLQQQSIAVVYTGLPGHANPPQLENDDLIEVRPGVYLVP